MTEKELVAVKPAKVDPLSDFQLGSPLYPVLPAHTVFHRETGGGQGIAKYLALSVVLEYPPAVRPTTLRDARPEVNKGARTAWPSKIHTVNFAYPWQYLALIAYPEFNGSGGRPYLAGILYWSQFPIRGEDVSIMPAKLPQIGASGEVCLGSDGYIEAGVPINLGMEGIYHRFFNGTTFSCSSNNNLPYPSIEDWEKASENPDVWQTWDWSLAKPRKLANIMQGVL